MVSSGCCGHGTLYHLVNGMAAENRSAFVSLNSIPVGFLPAMAEHLSRLGRRPVTPIGDAAPLSAGSFHVDIQKRSLLVQATADSVSVRALQGEDESEYGPGYFDLFLLSAADIFRDHLLIILLSGAETGTLEGLRYVRESGGSVYVQERSSCVVADFIPSLTAENLIDREIRPEAIAGEVIAWSRESQSAKVSNIIGI